MIATPLVLLAVAGRLMASPIDSSIDASAMSAAQPARDEAISGALVEQLVLGSLWQERLMQQAQFDATRFDSLTALRLRSFLDTAIEQGIPTAPLINLALQGSAQRASGTKIMEVVRAHAAALVEARSALGPRTPVSELNAGASALRAGVDIKTLEAIRSARPAGQAELPLVVVTDIVNRGVPVITARDAVTAIAKMPSSDGALNGLQLTVAKNSTRGPGMAVDALNRYVRGTLSGATPSSAPATTDRKPIRPPSP